MSDSPHAEPPVDGTGKAPGGDPTDEALGRAWVAPALLLAGALALGRAEVLARLASAASGHGLERARWSVLADWPALLVGGIVMGAAATAVVWSARGGRRPWGILLGGLFLVSALAGWPVSPAAETWRGDSAGLPELWQLGALCFGLMVLLSAAAAFVGASDGLRRLLGSTPVILVAGALGLGGSATLLGLRSEAAPTMPLREVLAELDPEVQGWRVLREAPRHSPRAGVLSPLVDLRFNRAEYDTGDKSTLLMSPPCEVEIVVPAGAEGARLLLAAQIDGRYTDRGVDAPGYAKASRLDDLGLDSISVRFQVEQDGATVFDETIVHRHEEAGHEREWRHVGADGALAVEPGSVITLRTDFGDEATRAAFAERGLDCGFGGLVLERWREAPRQRASVERPNLLFVTIDTLRADRMSCYGYDKPTTPHLDELARRGLRFDRAFATSSWTWPSTASLLTGLLPYEHGVLSNAACNLNHAYETLAEVLQARGYSTAAISCNPLIDETRQFDQGFERFDAGAQMRMTDEVIRDVRRELRQLADVRFFLYLHLVDPHTPHRPLPSELERLGGEAPDDFPHKVVAGVEVDGMDHYWSRLMEPEAWDDYGVVHPERVVPPAHMRWISDRYDASVGTADHYLGEVFDLLEELGLAETTVIAVTSDHGEELFDHGLLLHGHAIWREVVHVPLILAGPGLPEGERVHLEVSNRHLAPTLALVGGGELGAAREAVNLLDFEALEAAEDLGPVFYQTSKGLWNGHEKLELLGLREGGHAAHHAPQGGPWKEPAPLGGETRVFATDGDFGETTDLWSEPAEREVGEELRDAARASVEAQRERRQGGSVGIGSGGLGTLQAIGYVGEDETLEDARDESSCADDCVCGCEGAGDCDECKNGCEEAPAEPANEDSE